MNSFRFVLTPFFMFVIFLSLGCSSLQPLDTRLSKQEIVKEINIGDQIEIETGSGERRVITVLSISETYIEWGAGERFELADIQVISHRKYTIGEKTLEVAGLVSGVPISGDLETNKNTFIIFIGLLVGLVVIL